jgi:hypothetical protein
VRPRAPEPRRPQPSRRGHGARERLGLRNLQRCCGGVVGPVEGGGLRQQELDLGLAVAQLPGEARGDGQVGEALDRAPGLDADQAEAAQRHHPVVRVAGAEQVERPAVAAFCGGQVEPLPGRLCEVEFDHGHVPRSAWRQRPCIEVGTGRSIARSCEVPDAPLPLAWADASLQLDGSVWFIRDSSRDRELPTPPVVQN